MQMVFEPSQTSTCQELKDAVLSSLLRFRFRFGSALIHPSSIHSFGASGAVQCLPSCFGSSDVIGVAVNLENYGSMDVDDGNRGISQTLRGSLLFYYFSHSLLCIRRSFSQHAHIIVFVLAPPLVWVWLRGKDKHPFLSFCWEWDWDGSLLWA